MSDRIVELRSDTFTRPSEAMRRAMYEAEVGDDVWNEDPTVHRLEERSAQLMGKAAAVFVTSGTQGNLCGLLSHAAQGTEVIVGEQAHVFLNEAGGAAAVGGLQLRTLPNEADGGLDPHRVRAAIRADNIHYPPTAAVALENTQNRCGGTVQTIEAMRAVTDVAHAAGIPVHLDGARIFNAAVALGVPAEKVAAPVDSVTFCLSKALGAPVGSVLCGSPEYIERARRWRKILGGGMRQAGVLAAAGLVALNENVERLAEDHANARLLAEGLAEVPGIKVDLGTVQSNIVLFDVTDVGAGLVEFLAALADRGVRLAGGPVWDGPIARSEIRAVTSFEVNRDDIEYALHVIAEVARQATPVPA
jgi:threonine aldolase